MSAFSEFHQEALTEAIGIFGTLFTFNSASYRGVVNQIEIGSKFQDGGLLETLVTTVVVLRSDFATAPAVGQKLTIDGKLLRIEKVDRDEVSYTLSCVTAAI